MGRSKSDFARLRDNVVILSFTSRSYLILLNWHGFFLFTAFFGALLVIVTVQLRMLRDLESLEGAPGSVTAGIS